MTGRTPGTRERLLILGASARSAAQSALRAGFEPFAVDQFADTDLLDCCRAIRVRRFPADLVSAVDQLPEAPWMYTGALENAPAILAAIGRIRPLWGCAADAARSARDPWQLERILREGGLLFPAVRPLEGHSPEGRWLRKPVRSAGGRGISFWDGTAAAARVAAPGASDRGSHYLQRWVAGCPCSAVYVAARGTARLLGITQQLIGCQWAGACGFRYVGSVGPLSVNLELGRQFVRIGERLAESLPLTGLFGVDAVIDRQAVWVIELNPRYTASIEVLERALGLTALTYHAAACRDGRLPSQLPAASAGIWGKAILAARRPLEIPTTLAARVAAANAPSRWPRIADVPAAGEILRPGQPILTVFARADSLRDTRRKLRQLASSVHRWLGNHSPE